MDDEFARYLLKKLLDYGESKGWFNVFESVADIKSRL